MHDHKLGWWERNHHPPVPRTTPCPPPSRLCPGAGLVWGTAGAGEPLREHTGGPGQPCPGQGKAGWARHPTWEWVPLFPVLLLPQPGHPAGPAALCLPALPAGTCSRPPATALLGLATAEHRERRAPRLRHQTRLCKGRWEKGASSEPPHAELQGLACQQAHEEKISSEFNFGEMLFSCPQAWKPLALCGPQNQVNKYRFSFARANV